jgi:hypothetical protein
VTCRSTEPEVNVGELLEKLKLLARNPKLKEWAEKSGSELMAELNGKPGSVPLSSTVLTNILLIHFKN